VKNDLIIGLGNICFVYSSCQGFTVIYIESNVLSLSENALTLFSVGFSVLHRIVFARFQTLVSTE